LVMRLAIIPQMLSWVAIASFTSLIFFKEQFGGAKVKKLQSLVLIQALAHCN